jgi:hypothetical protein
MKQIKLNQDAGGTALGVGNHQTIEDPDKRRQRNLDIFHAIIGFLFILILLLLVIAAFFPNLFDMIKELFNKGGGDKDKETDKPVTDGSTPGDDDDDGSDNNKSNPFSTCEIWMYGSGITLVLVTIIAMRFAASTKRALLYCMVLTICLFAIGLALGCVFGIPPCIALSMLSVFSFTSVVWYLRRYGASRYIIVQVLAFSALTSVAISYCTGAQVPTWAFAFGGLSALITLGSISRGAFDYKLPDNDFQLPDVDGSRGIAGQEMLELAGITAPPMLASETISSVDVINSSNAAIAATLATVMNESKARGLTERVVNSSSRSVTVPVRDLPKDEIVQRQIKNAVRKQAAVGKAVKTLNKKTNKALKTADSSERLIIVSKYKMLLAALAAVGVAVSGTNEGWQKPPDEFFAESDMIPSINNTPSTVDISVVQDIFTDTAARQALKGISVTGTPSRDYFNVINKLSDINGFDRQTKAQARLLDKTAKQVDPGRQSTWVDQMERLANPIGVDFDAIRLENDPYMNDDGLIPATIEDTVIPTSRVMSTLTFVSGAIFVMSGGASHVYHGITDGGSEVELHPDVHEEGSFQPTSILQAGASKLAGAFEEAGDTFHKSAAESVKEGRHREPVQRYEP